MPLIYGEGIPDIYRRKAGRPEANAIPKKDPEDDWMGKIERILVGINELMSKNPNMLGAIKQEQGGTMSGTEISKLQGGLIFDVIRSAFTRMPNRENMSVEQGLGYLDQFRDQIIDGLVNTLNKAGILNSQANDTMDGESTEVWT